MTAGASVAMLSTAEPSSTDTVTPDPPAMPRSSSRAALIASIGCLNCESCPCNCSQICGMRPLQIDKGAAITSAKTTSKPMNNATTMKAERPDGRPQPFHAQGDRPQHQADDDAERDRRQDVLAGMQARICTPRGRSGSIEAWAPCASSSSMFDFGGKRWTTIGAFFGVRLDIGIFRLDLTTETPFHASRFRRTEPRRVSSV